MANDPLAALLRDAILGTLARVGAETDQQKEALLWPVLDYIMLLFQAPCYVTLAAATRRGNGLEPAGGSWPASTLPPPDRSWLGLPSVFEEVETLCESSDPTDPLVFPVSGAHVLLLSVRLLPGAEDFEGFSREAARELLDDGSLRERLFDALMAHGSQRSERYSGKRKESKEPRPDPSIFEDCLEPLRTSLGQVFQEVSSFQGIASADSSPTNLFAVIRRPVTAPREVKALVGEGKDGSGTICRFPYTASLFFPEPQRAWIESLPWPSHLLSTLPTSAGNNAGGRCSPLIATLETPLGPGSRSITDTAFCSGHVVFSLPEERSASFSRDSAQQEGDRLRSTFESWLYERFDEVLPTRRGPHVFFFVPIHVGGSPWMTLFLLSRRAPDGASDWKLRNYHFLRDVIPALANSIALAAQTAYVEALVDAAYRVGQQSALSESKMDRINAHWRQIAEFYPFQPLSLAKSGKEPRLRLPDGTEAFLHSLPKDPPPQIHLRVVPDEVMREQIARASSKLSLAHAEALTSFVEDFGHRLKNSLHETGWETRLEELRKLRPGDPLTADLRQKLIAAFSRLWIPAGLGAAMRDFATLRVRHGQELQDQWLTSGGASFLFDDEAVGTYRRSLKRVLESLASSYASIHGTVLRVVESQPTSLSSEADGVGIVDLAPQALRFPPLRGSFADRFQGPIVLASIVGEPAKNAAEYLAREESLPDHLRTLFWTAEATEGGSELLVTLWNPVADQHHNKPSSGVLIANRLARGLNIGAIEPTDAPYLRKIEGEEIWLRKVVIRLHPQRLGGG